MGVAISKDTKGAIDATRAKNPMTNATGDTKVKDTMKAIETTRAKNPTSRTRATTKRKEEKGSAPTTKATMPKAAKKRSKLTSIFALCRHFFILFSKAKGCV